MRLKLMSGNRKELKASAISPAMWKVLNNFEYEKPDIRSQLVYDPEQQKEVSDEYLVFYFKSDKKATWIENALQKERLQSFERNGYWLKVFSPLKDALLAQLQSEDELLKLPLYELLNTPGAVKANEQDA